MEIVLGVGFLISAVVVVMLVMLFIAKESGVHLGEDSDLWGGDD